MNRRASLALLLLLAGLAPAGEIGAQGPDDAATRAATDNDDDRPDWDAEWGDGWDAGWDDPGWGGESAVRAVTGFVEGAAGTRWNEDPRVGRRGTLLDLRWRVETGWRGEAAEIDAKADILADGIDKDLGVEARELALSFSPLDSLDVRAGRQVLTWGTGDLLFLNDLFPKGWVSFFAGRDDEYLKAPSDSLRLTWYTGLVNVDFAWTPEFTPDEYVRGERFSYFSPAAGEIVGPEPPLVVDEPSGLDDAEFALRLFRTLRGVEYALYAYRGFFKTPSRVLPSGKLGFAPLTSLGASLRRPAGPGLLNLETSWYVSRDDRDGSDPAVNNGQLRFLAGYEWEAARNFTVGLQYYLERTLDYDALIENSPQPTFEPPENRHVVTTRLTWRTLQDKLTWSFFAFVSPNDDDAYLRPIVSWRADDHWTTTFGLNLFGGSDPYTFLGQFEDNSNAYLRVRYNY